ncbi:MAG: choice-of-anchor D domain-containing protein, partial [Acidobacteria bacterium]|nr:choice-of-anchor D domain-containing protein [Acidobacteriota bacterium]
GLGIDLSDDGRTANDAGDGDTGANNLQNFPVITSVGELIRLDLSRATVVEGRLNSTPNTDFTLQFFANSGCPPGDGDFEGKAFIGSSSVRTDDMGDASFRSTLDFFFSVVTPEPHVITATATDAGNNTSEFTQPLLLVCSPNIKVDPTLLDFGLQRINIESVPKPVSLRNDGHVNITVSSIQLAGSQIGQFVLSGLPSLPMMLSPGQSFTVNVAFKPTTVGSKTGSLLIASNDPTEPTVAVSLTGIGVAPDIEVSPTSLAFGNQCLNTQSTAHPVTISNTGTAPLTITASTNSNEIDFILIGLLPLPRTLAPGASVIVNSFFKPTTVGTKTGLLTIASDDPDEPTQTINLSGMGVAPELSVVPTSLAFGNQLINTQSTPQTVTITNNNSSCASKVREITLAGANPNDFILMNVPALPRDVGPNQRLVFEVAFKPSSVGAKTARLTITSDDPDQPTSTIDLSGTGVAPDMDVTPLSLAFGNQCVNAQSAPQTVTVSNSGTAPLTINTITSSNTIDFVLMVTPPPPRTVPPGGNFTFMVAFKPMTTGTKSGMVIIAGNDPDESTRTVSLSGVGVAQDINVSPTSIDFGMWPYPPPSSPPGPMRTLTVSNTSMSCSLTVSAISRAGANPTDFTLSGLPALPRTVTPGASFTFSVIFSPGGVGTRSTSVQISSSDPDESMVNVALSGSGASITVTTPNGGENWAAGSAHTISWTSAGVIGNVKILLSTNGGSSYPTTIASNTANDGSYPSTVPSTLGSTTCRIRIESVSTSLVFDTSNANFTVSQITVSVPNGHEAWCRGSTHTILWSSVGVSGNVRIELSTNGGSTYPTVITSSTANDGSYSWTIPSATPASNLCRVRITALSAVTSGPNPANASDANFCICSNCSSCSCP